MIPATLDNATQGELKMYENNYKILNLITTAIVGMCMIMSLT
jgi:hypothetical protein